MSTSNFYNTLTNLKSHTSSGGLEFSEDGKNAIHGELKYLNCSQTKPKAPPCSRPLCKCADFGAVEPRNLGDFRSNFNGGEILRASLFLSPRLIFSSK